MTSNPIGDKIKHLRNLRDMKQYDLAKKLNVANSTISNWENGRRLPSISELRRIAAFFEVSLSVFEIADSTLPPKETKSFSLANQYISFRKLGLFIPFSTLLILFIGSTFIFMSILIESLLAFTFYFLGLLMLIYGFFNLIVIKNNHNNKNEKEIIIPMHVEVYYIHQNDEIAISKIKSILVKLSMILNISTISFFIVLSLVFIPVQNSFVMMFLSLFAFVTLTSALFVYKIFLNNNIIQKNLDYYDAHHNLKYFSISFNMFLQTAVFISHMLIVIVFDDLFTNSNILFFSSLLSLMNMSFAFYLFYKYNKFVFDFDLYAKDEGNRLKRLT